MELARRWNGATYSLFILHGNIFDVFPVQEAGGTAYVPLKTFLSRRLFPDRGFLLFYDISDGLTFGNAEMQKLFFEWLAVYDQVENTAFRQQGPPREFTRIAPLLRRFFLHAAEQNKKSITLVIDFPEKIVPASADAHSSIDERMALVTLLKWATEMRRLDIGLLLVTEASAKLAGDLLQNPHVAQVAIELPEAGERLRFLQAYAAARNQPVEAWSDFSLEELAGQLSGLNLSRIEHLLAEAVGNGGRITAQHVGLGKKRLIEEYCQGLVRFKNPKPGMNLDAVATHGAAKARLRELAWLIANGKRDVLERGVLLPGRVGVGKSFLVDCFASECGLPMMELGEFRSKWVGDTELQQGRILMTIRALGPVIVVVDEADAVFGTREADGDSGVSGRVFAAFAAHLGDSSLRGRELWIAMTSRPDLLSIDMKRQGRFGLCIPLFPAQGHNDVLEQFNAIASFKKITLTEPMLAFVDETLGARALTGSDVDAMLTRAKERAVLAGRDQSLEVVDLQEAVNSFIDPLDPQLLALQELAAVLACSDRRYLPDHYANADRASLSAKFALLKGRLRR
ncbi:MAG: hypothetical protein JWL59_12 [Chthoniobacteraceae bacterium]|nr:hypothetical protein [Chthoniobacteraceae bacterium]